MPLGDVQARVSGKLKNTLVERVDSIEPTLAHVIPEMSSNAVVVLAALFSALKLPAIGVMLGALLSGSVTTKAILLSLPFDKFGQKLTFFWFLAQIVELCL